MSSVVRQGANRSCSGALLIAAGFVIMPRLPIVEWLADLDASLEQSKGFLLPAIRS